MRVCRVCLLNDVHRSFRSCFSENGRIAYELFTMFGIIMVETKDDRIPPALICRKCEKIVSQACELKKKCLKSDLHIKAVSHFQIPKLISSKQELEQTCKQDARAEVKTPEIKTKEHKQEATTSTTKPVQEAMTSIDSLQVEQEEQEVVYNIDADFIAEAEHILEEVIDGDDPEIEIKKEPINNDEDNQSRVSTPSTLVMDYDVDFSDIDSISLNELKKMTRSICDLIPKDIDDTLDEILKASNQDEHVSIISSNTNSSEEKVEQPVATTSRGRRRGRPRLHRWRRGGRVAGRGAINEIFSIAQVPQQATTSRRRGGRPRKRRGRRGRTPAADIGVGREKKEHLDIFR